MVSTLLPQLPKFHCLQHLYVNGSYILVDHLTVAQLPEEALGDLVHPLLPPLTVRFGLLAPVPKPF